ncbi:Stage II sporulation protein M [Brevinema andersonii]|uniref:Stage II sporulation protein M n=1 Tax=Brevinema andersonii TaxID=34097 RepID=A0A1I1EDA7_BREAD|nr:stage II sporulation protein M [Brevinema andersonii]SFB85075.1 Stage II sporulation protein M [Brevinema andersonii]
MPNYKQFFIHSLKEFFYSCFIALTACLLLPQVWLYNLFFSLSNMISYIRFSFYTLLLSNLCSGLLIFFWGTRNDRFITFFLILNGTLLGVTLAFLKNISIIAGLLFPHAFFETPAIIALAALIRFYSASISTQHKKISIQTIILCFGLVIPLFIISAFLEARSHYGF